MQFDKARVTREQVVTLAHHVQQAASPESVGGEDGLRLAQLVLEFDRAILGARSAASTAPSAVPPRH
ncbi:MAG: hypothetical protein ACRELB_21985 [Polyangiaceae bacterium]